ncbi:hypothetical protein NDI45_12755 [Leptolyngbya sp. GB1-A1]|uniref:hypothetical protein n=1 Tax=Leptolyngbya sp. GB1-A1 TaxID=2933908 RepID=UPI0032973CDB
MKAVFRPNQPVKPIAIVLTAGFIVAIGSGIVAGVRKGQEMATQQRQQQQAEQRKYPVPLMQKGLDTLNASSSKLDKQIVAGLAWQYLQQANATDKPILWIRKKANDISFDISQQYNTRLIRSEKELEYLHTLKLRSEAIGLLMNAVAQGKESEIQNSTDLFPLVRETNNLRSIYDSQVVEKRYPDEN